MSLLASKLHCDKASRHLLEAGCPGVHSPSRMYVWFFFMDVFCLHRCLCLWLPLHVASAFCQLQGKAKEPAKAIPLSSLYCLWLTYGIFLVSDEVSGTPALEGLYLQGKPWVYAKSGWKTLCGYIHMSPPMYTDTQ